MSDDQAPIIADDNLEEVDETETPAGTTPRKARNANEPDDRVIKAATKLLSPSEGNITVPWAMRECGFTDEESKDRALQQRVRRLHKNFKENGVVVINGKTVTTEKPDFSKYIPFGEKACEFLTQSTDPFLAVKTCTDTLDAAGFVRLSKREPFGGKLVPGGSYYYTINHSTLVAFTVGSKYKAGNGFKIIGGHTDSPHLKVKPHSKRSAAGCVQLGVECYGGGLWHTWFDRDLGISGRVLVRVTDPETGKEKIEQRIVRIPRPVARVSTLCIHLQTAEERGAFKVNKEEHLSPILGTQTLLERGVKSQINRTSDYEDPWANGQEPELMQLIASELDIETKQIANFELGLFDCQPASLGGIKNEFLHSARLDNLATCFVATETLLDYSKSADVDEDDMVSLIALFDHEEIGSQSTHGAASPVMTEAVSRITAAFSENTHSRDPELHSSAVRRSFVFSVDQAHAVHPNYQGKHEKNHGPRMNAGVVIKTNQNQRYATNGVTGFIAREVARKAEDSIPLQEFVVRSDCPCGTTIGPILSANTGIRTVDLGMPQLSMHSCRETMGVADLTNGLNLFKSFFKNFNEIDEMLEG